MCLDVGAYYKGYHSDSAKTHGVGVISEEDRKLIEVAKESFYEGIKFAKLGYRLSDISHAIQHTLRNMVSQLLEI